MTAKGLRELSYQVSDDAEVVVLNENAPVKGATPIEQLIVMKNDKGKETLVLVYQSKNGKEGNK